MIPLSKLKKLIKELDDSCVVEAVDYSYDGSDQHILIYLPDESGTFLDIPIGFESTPCKDPVIWMNKNHLPLNPQPENNIS